MLWTLLIKAAMGEGPDTAGGAVAAIARKVAFILAGMGERAKDISK